jgi:hypothetical protein
METDTEANMSYQDMHAGTTNVTFHRLPYHSIQLVVRQVEKQPSFVSLIAKVLGIVTSVRVSSVATQMMIQKCGKTLISDCSTRWNSTLFMLNRLLECKGTVIDVFTQQGWHCLQNSEWLKAEQLANMLQPFADHTNILQSDSLSLSGIIPVLKQTFSKYGT